MKRIMFGMAMLVMAFATMYGQEHYTEGNLREVSFYRTKPGQFDEYMKYLRANFLPMQEEAKKQGLIVGYSVMLKTPATASDWDVAIVTIHKNFAALDYNKGDEDRMNAIMEKQYKTADQNKQQQMMAKRFEMRDYIGTNYIREVTLKPMP